MAIVDLYSKRNELSGKVPDIFQYDNFSQKVRVQIWHILAEHSSDYYEIHGEGFWETVHRILIREYGVFNLHPRCDEPWKEIRGLIINDKYDKVLDTIELSFNGLCQWYSRRDRAQRANEMVKELNHRFKENGLGYEFKSGKIIKITSQYAHEKITKPTLQLLSENGFEGAQEEFYKAYEHYRHGRHKEAIAECQKSFESCMKTICSKLNFSYKQNDPSKKLIDTLIANGLVPEELKTYTQTKLKSGLPTMRNHFASHGQGERVQELPESFVRFCLHTAATNMLFLVERYKERSSRH